MKKLNQHEKNLIDPEKKTIIKAMQAYCKRTGASLTDARTVVLEYLEKENKELYYEKLAAFLIQTIDSVLPLDSDEQETVQQALQEKLKELV